mmetsp:Transcript_1726/g.4424  ORF Transcript_1726/g.4424 Transcript_1726/m.4424 type:complete len:237 (+) Transcript_1726:7674-8384(+)
MGGKGDGGVPRLGDMKPGVGGGGSGSADGGGGGGKDGWGAGDELDGGEMVGKKGGNGGGEGKRGGAGGNTKGRGPQSEQSSPYSQSANCELAPPSSQTKSWAYKQPSEHKRGKGGAAGGDDGEGGNSGGNTPPDSTGTASIEMPRESVGAMSIDTSSVKTVDNRSAMEMKPDPKPGAMKGGNGGNGAVIDDPGDVPTGYGRDTEKSPKDVSVGKDIAKTPLVLGGTIPSPGWLTYG